MLSRDEGLKLLKKYLKSENLIKHSFAVEAILKEMARHLNEDEDLWALTGLIHDLDYEYTKDEPQSHTKMTAQILNGIIEDEIIEAILAHNYQHTQQVPETSLDKSLIAADALSGLIIAAALVMPSKSIHEVKLSTLIDKFKDKSFAAKCDRKRIQLCEDVDIPLNDFLQMSLIALQNISNELGL